jgi:hypothetical protein
MALAVPTRQPVPPLRTQARTFLGACVDEALEQRENPWDSARLHRECVEQRLSAIEEKLAGIKTSAAAMTRPKSLPPLPPGVGLAVAILIDLFPQTRGDPGLLPRKKIQRVVNASPRLKAERDGRTLSMSVINEALAYIRDGKLPRHRR